MKNLKWSAIALAAALASVPGAGVANEWLVSEGAAAKGGASSFTVGFAGNGVVTDAMIDLAYNASAFDVKVSALSGAYCSVHPKGGIVRVISPESNEALSAKTAAYCQIDLVSKDGASVGGSPLSVIASECAFGAGKSVACDNSGAALAR